MPQGRLEINPALLNELEGFRTEGYLPKDKKGKVLGKSGVTIGRGIDLSWQSEKKLRDAGVSPDDIRILKPYLGEKARGKKGEKLLEKRPLVVDEGVAGRVSDAIQAIDLETLIETFDAKSSVPFMDLTSEQQTVLASVSHQYGATLGKAPKFLEKAAGGDWNAVYEELVDFGDAYITRRRKEAETVGGNWRVGEEWPRTLEPNGKRIVSQEGDKGMLNGITN